MYNFICKECGKEFSASYKTAKYCSKDCRIKNTNNNLTHNIKDLTGKKYGKLTVIEKAYVKNERSYWRCICDCGKEKIASIDALNSGTTKSCGCLVTTTSSIHMKTNEKILNNRLKIFKEGTNLANISNEKLFKNNTSGKKGVYWSNYHQRWMAYIIFQNKRHYLGCFKDKDKAIRERLKAEEKYFKPILEKYQNIIEKK